MGIWNVSNRERVNVLPHFVRQDVCVYSAFIAVMEILDLSLREWEDLGMLK